MLCWLLFVGFLLLRGVSLRIISFSRCIFFQLFALQLGDVGLRRNLIVADSVERAFLVILIGLVILVGLRYLTCQNFSQSFYIVLFRR